MPEPADAAAPDRGEAEGGTDGAVVGASNRDCYTGAEPVASSPDGGTGSEAPPPPLGRDVIYGDGSAEEYLSWGWSPVPVDGKGTTPGGCTGYRGRMVDADDVARWTADSHRYDNLVLRPPEFVVALDVDAYRPGAAEALTAVLAECGLAGLPPTLVTGARLDVPGSWDGSGIWWYRLPEELARFAGERVWRSQLCEHVEIVRFGHRQGVVYPSVHPGLGKRYGWTDLRTGAGDELAPWSAPGSVVPVVDYSVPPVKPVDLPEIPGALGARLLKSVEETGARTRRRRAAVEAGEPEPAEEPEDSEPEPEWLADLWTDGRPCRAVASAFVEILLGLPDHRYDSMTSGSLRLARLGEQGHSGTLEAAQTLRAEYVKRVTLDGSRDRWTAAAEWSRAVADLVGVLRLEGLTAPEDRGCCGPGAADAVVGAVIDQRTAAGIEQAERIRADVRRRIAEEQAAEGADPDSFRARALDDAVHGRKPEVLPEVMTVVDKSGAVRNLIYPGVNWLFGESGDGKSLLAATTAAQVLSAGVVLWVEYEEADEATLVSRLLDLGVHPDVLLDRLVFVTPQTRSRGDDVDQLIRSALDRSESAGVGVRLVVLDSVGEAFGVESVNENSDAEVAPWVNRFLRRLARGLPDAAVLPVDHGTKAKEHRLHPSGSKRKRAAVTGSMLLVESDVPFARGVPGRARIVCAKDRHGHHRRGDVVGVMTVEPGIGEPGPPVVLGGVACVGRVNLIVRLVDQSLGMLAASVPEVGAEPPTTRHNAEKVWLAMVEIADAAHDYAGGKPLSKAILTNAVTAKVSNGIKAAAVEHAVRRGVLRQEKVGQTLTHTWVREPNTADREYLDGY